jgi:dipeptidyl aminopeptidase/acylaminoacyl peptidase
MQRAISFVLLLLVSSLASAEARHPLTFEDMMALKRLGPPLPSPDGKWVLFSTVDVNLAANTKTPHVWVAPSTGGDAHMLMADQDGNSPRWAPDGKRFVFVSNKEQGSQLWIAGFDSSAGTVSGVRRLTSIATEADGPIWSPDGSNLAFTSSVYPECTGSAAEAAACNAKRLDEAASSKVKAMVFTGLLYRHWNAYLGGKRSHIFVVRADGSGAPRDLTPGDYDSPVFSLGGQDNYVFSPDGKELCYASNHDKVEATSTNSDLWIVPVNGGEAVNLTASNPAWDGSPLYSPDGRYIAYRAQMRAGYESDRFRLMLYDRETKKTKNLTEKFNRWVGTFTWSVDSFRIYFNAEDKGEAPIYSIFLRSEEIRELTRGYNDDLAPAPDGKSLFLSRMSLQAPNEIYQLAICPAGCPPPLPEAKAVTHLNDAVLAKVDVNPIEPFFFTGSEETVVQGFLVRPPNFDPEKKYPVKFLIHGGPQGAWGDDWSYRWNRELFAANGYLVVMVNPRGSTGYGQQFIDDINGDWGGRAFEDLMKGLDYAEKKYPFLDKNRECALGASFGGYMVNWIMGHTDRFKCIVSHDGMFNTDSAWGTTEELWFNEWEFKGTPYTNRDLYRKWSPHLSATNFKTPTLVVHGQLDYRLDVSEGFQLFTTLQRQGVPSKMLYFPDEGHWVLKPQNSQLWYKTVNDWVDEWLKK